MIAGLRGKVFTKSTTKILLDVSGVIYEVFMPLNDIEKVKQEDTILTTQIIREDASLLFGFLDVAQKQAFDNLIKISGVGPKVALTICNYFTPIELITITTNNDYISLKKVPGIGEKSAKRIILELKIDNINKNDLNTPKQEAISALESLGFKKDEIIKLIEKSTSTITQDIIKDVLRYAKK